MSKHSHFNKLGLGLLAVIATMAQATIMIASPVTAPGVDAREAGRATPLSCAAAPAASSGHRQAGCADPAEPGRWA